MGEGSKKKENAAERDEHIIENFSLVPLNPSKLWTVEDLPEKDRDLLCNSSLKHA